eukprot:TRINITY_DN1317_c0_g1_i1.p1 TRINITY_DN1317_c0_g1~~TRINITY_DN1317_c0_g1_i1.p1  ORF type:complete len:362 (-),score=119.04 TRINITY_DN1317_c0_g1_i1:1863-2834(-)
MKMTTHPLLEHIDIVDSPGMIDSVGNERDYDFMSSVKWFVEHSALVLFFFDPDKPGTCSESLRVFTDILSRADHKLLIVLNKVDLFTTMGDMTRSYGTLAFNLGKVIASKDMPHIFATYLPGKTSNARQWGMQEFDAAREAIEKQIRAAPARHVDNLITEAQAYTEGLHMHVTVLSSARALLMKFRHRLLLCAAAVDVLVAALLLFALSSLGATPWPPLALFLCLLLLQGVALPYLTCMYEARLTRDGLDSIFAHSYDSELNDPDQSEYFARMWGRQRSGVRRVLKFGLASFPPDSGCSAELRVFLDKHIPRMLNEVRAVLVR